MVAAFTDENGLAAIAGTTMPKRLLSAKTPRVGPVIFWVCRWPAIQLGGGE
jgi:hypothetical protein